jgi:dUTPase
MTLTYAARREDMASTVTLEGIGKPVFITSPTEYTVPAEDIATVNTNLHIYIPEGMRLKLVATTPYWVKMVSQDTMDPGEAATNCLIVIFHNWSKSEMVIKKNETILKAYLEPNFNFAIKKVSLDEVYSMDGWIACMPRKPSKK